MSEEIYKGEFADAGWNGKTGWQAVQAEFRMDEPEPEEVLLAQYETPAYEGAAYVLYRNGDRYFYVEGSHCSCMGLEYQWDPEEYDLDKLIAATERVAGNDRQSVYSFLGGNAIDLLPRLLDRKHKEAGK